MSISPLLKNLKVDFPDFPDFPKCAILHHFALFTIFVKNTNIYAIPDTITSTLQYATKLRRLSFIVECQFCRFCPKCQFWTFVGTSSRNVKMSLFCTFVKNTNICVFQTQITSALRQIRNCEICRLLENGDFVDFVTFSTFRKTEKVDFSDFQIFPNVSFCTIYNIRENHEYLCYLKHGNIDFTVRFALEYIRLFCNLKPSWKQVKSQMPINVTNCGCWVWYYCLGVAVLYFYIECNLQ